MANRRVSPNGTAGAAPPPRGAGASGWWNLLLLPPLFVWLLSFTDRPVSIVVVPGLFAFFALVERCRTFKEVFLWTGLFGAAGTAIGYHWLAGTVQLFGGLDPASAWGAVAAFGVAGIVHAWIFAAVYRAILDRGHRPHPIATAVLVIAAETLPIRLFPWMIGHSVVTTAPLRQSAEWGGVPGVTFATLCLVVPAYEWFRALLGLRARPRAAAVAFALGVLLYGWGAWRHADVRAAEADATRHVRVAIVQANVGSLDKRAAENGTPVRQRSIDAYRRGTEAAVEAGAEFVVWPETAITDAVPLSDARQTNLYLQSLGYRFLDDLGDRAFLAGIYEAIREPTRVGQAPRDRRYNAAALRRPDGTWSRYRKVYLIPFGETMPFGIMEDRLPQSFEMVPGDSPQPLLETDGLTFATFLCYEGILDRYALASVHGRRPDLLMSLANDSWFGDSWEPWQHLNFTTFRAVEHRAPIVRSTNTGVSAFVSATGDVEAKLGIGVEDVLVRNVPLVERGPTVFVRFGHHLPAVCWILAVLIWLGALLRPRRA